MHKKNQIMKIMAVIFAAALTAVSVCACGDGGSDGGNDKEKISGAYNIGEWIEISKKAEADDKDHDAKVKLTKVIKDEAEVIELIEKYNVSGVNETISTETGNDKTVFAAAEYEVKFSKDFPESEFGLTDVTVPFDIVGENGEESIDYEGTKFDGLTKTKEIGSVPQGYDFYLPDHYKGRIIYLIPEGCETYLFRTKGRDGKYVYISPAEKTEEGSEE